MLSRQSTSVLSCATRRLGVRYGSHAKKRRIDVQLLKDFPGIGSKGQIVQVKPSAMINRLHPSNGAVYMNHPGAQPVIEVYVPPKVSRHHELHEANEVVKETVVKAAIKKAKPDLLSLEQLVNLDLTELGVTDRESVAAKIPKNLVVYRSVKNEKLENPLDPSRVKRLIERAHMSRVQEKKQDSKAKSELLTSSSQLFDSQNLKVETTKTVDGKQQPVDLIDTTGDYTVKLSVDDQVIAETKIKVLSDAASTESESN